MSPKFKLWDKVNYLKYCSTAPAVGTIEQIRITGYGVSYLMAGHEIWISESGVTPYIEPKPKVKKYKYAFESVYNDNGLVVSFFWYESDEEFEKKNPFVKEFERLSKWWVER